MSFNEGKRLTIKELAAALGRNRTFVSAMRANGFVMPGNMATLDAAVAWLAVHPSPRSRKLRRRKAITASGTV